MPKDELELPHEAANGGEAEVSSQEHASGPEGPAGGIRPPSERDQKHREPA